MFIAQGLLAAPKTNPADDFESFPEIDDERTPNTVL
jgi:hypothetical protein